MKLLFRRKKVYQITLWFKIKQFKTDIQTFQESAKYL